MIYELARWVLNTRPLMAVRHALELDHSPSRSCIGTCPCKGCARAKLQPLPEWWLGRGE